MPHDYKSLRSLAYQVVLAYRYTSVASVMLLDGFTVPCAMLPGCSIIDGSRAKVSCLKGW